MPLLSSVLGIMELAPRSRALADSSPSLCPRRYPEEDIVLGFVVYALSKSAGFIYIGRYINDEELIICININVN